MSMITLTPDSAVARPLSEHPDQLQETVMVSHHKNNALPHADSHTSQLAILANWRVSCFAFRVS